MRRYYFFCNTPHSPLDAGAEDFSEEDDSYEIITLPDDFSAVREAIEAEKIPMASAEVTMLPQTYVTLTDENDYVPEI